MNLLLFQSRSGKTIPVIEDRAFRGASWPRGPEKWKKLRGQLVDGYQKIRERLDHDEKVCGGLRHVESLEVAHSARTGRDDARGRLNAMLETGLRKHSRWFVVDSVLAAFGGMLMPLPGPNIFFFYPAIRALGHYLAKDGARKGLRVRVSFREDKRMDQVERQPDSPDEGLLTELERDYGIHQLSIQLSKLRD